MVMPAFDRSGIGFLGHRLPDLMRPERPEIIEVVRTDGQRGSFHPRYLGDDLGKAAAAHSGDVICYRAHQNATIG